MTQQENNDMTEYAWPFGLFPLLLHTQAIVYYVANCLSLFSLLLLLFIKVQ